MSNAAANVTPSNTARRIVSSVADIDTSNTVYVKAQVAASMMPAMRAAHQGNTPNLDAILDAVTSPREDVAGKPAVDSRAGLGDWISPGMDNAARARVMANEDAAREAGFALRDTLYARGRLINRVGVQNATEERAKWEAKPSVPVAMRDLRGVVAAEEREDVTCLASDLGMSEDGYMVVRGRAGRLAVEREAMPQVFQRLAATCNVSSPGGTMGDWSRGHLIHARVVAFNALAAQVGEDHLAAKAHYDSTPVRHREIEKMKAPEAPMVVLRTRLDDGGMRGVFAGVSPKYAAVDADTLAQACEDVAGASDLRADVYYDRRRCKIDLLAHSNVNPERCAVGEAYQYGIRLETSDTGQGGIKVYGVLWRNLCENYIIIDQSVLKIAALRHIGDPVRLRKEVEAALATAKKKGRAIFEAWDKGCDTMLLGRAGRDNLGTHVRADRGSDTLLNELLANYSRQQQANQLRDELLAGMFRGLVHSKVLPVGLRKIDTDDGEDVLDMLLRAHDDRKNAGAANEHGVTLASLSNAVSLYAHAYQDDRWDEIQLERAAGEILSLKGAVPWAGDPGKLALA